MAIGWPASLDQPAARQLAGIGAEPGAVAGLVSAALLAGLALPVFHGPQWVPVAAAVSLLSAWMTAAGGWVWRQRG